MTSFGDFPEGFSVDALVAAAGAAATVSVVLAPTTAEIEVQTSPTATLAFLRTISAKHLVAELSTRSFIEDLPLGDSPNEAGLNLRSAAQVPTNGVSAGERAPVPAVAAQAGIDEDSDDDDEAVGKRQKTGDPHVRSKAAAKASPSFAAVQPSSPPYQRVQHRNRFKPQGRHQAAPHAAPHAAPVSADPNKHPPDTMTKFGVTWAVYCRRVNGGLCQACGDRNHSIQGCRDPAWLRRKAQLAAQTAAAPANKQPRARG